MYFSTYSSKANLLLSDYWKSVIWCWWLSIAETLDTPVWCYSSHLLSIAGLPPYSFSNSSTLNFKYIVPRTLESHLMAPVLPTAVTPDLLHIPCDSSLQGSQVFCASGDSSEIHPVLPFCFQTAFMWSQAHAQGPQASHALSSPHCYSTSVVLDMLGGSEIMLVVTVDFITQCTTGLAVALSWLNCIKKAWTLSCVSLSGRLLILASFSKPEASTKHGGTCSPWNFRPPARMTGLGQQFQKLLEGTARQEMKTCSERQYAQRNSILIGK